jgi:hypothetical protein
MFYRWSSQNDAVVSNYIPNASMPMLYYRVNFIFVDDPNQNSIYSGIPQSQIAADAANVVALMNSWFSTCGSIPATKPSPNPSPLVANPKIQLVLNNVYFESSPLSLIFDL